MAILRPFPRFLAAAFAAPKAMLSRMKWTLDRHSDFLENIEGEDGVEVRRNYKGGVTIRGGSGSSGTSAAKYYSYFKLYDASGLDGTFIGVKDGRPGAGTASCGFCKVNGTLIEIEHFREEVAASANYKYVWLHSWVDAAGEHAKIIVGSASSTPPDNPEEGYLWASQLIGRFTLVDGIFTINQDYLRGGEHSEYLFGDCGFATAVGGE